ncbi:zinc-binding alcohol dehydrogenase family protein [Streptomyces violarus]|uniref:alcohol dehydrogenase n=1 Tax=Streptomyces violarus TaxID=67380 RepID=A0A7W5F3R7_9ACTN|nr:zinc-binding alcohol dehydrogenase family protein [Streptomyces violarus]
MPVPADDELLVRVRACGVCRTDLHVAEGDLPVHRVGVTPGHEVVGTVAGAGAAVRGLAVGDRVGVAWLRRTDGDCAYCARGAENLCPESEYTGWYADGGYAEYTTVPAAFAYRMPDDVHDVAPAPLLCAGIIGHRALRRAALPPGGRLGLYGFGGSAHGVRAPLPAVAGCGSARGPEGGADRRGGGVGERPVVRRCAPTVQAMWPGEQARCGGGSGVSGDGV